MVRNIFTSRDTALFCDTLVSRLSFSAGILPILVHLVHDSMTSYNNPTFLIFLKAKLDAVDQIENLIQIDLKTDDKSNSNTSHFLHRRR